MGSGLAGSGSLAVIVEPCNRLSREPFGPPIWARKKRDMTGTAVAFRSFFLASQAGIRPVRFNQWRTIMAYDRYDTRESPRDERSRWRDDRFEGRDRGYSGREDRGFFERAGDEIASWFGDDDAERRRREDQRMMERDRGYRRDWRGGEERSQSFGRDRDEDRGRFYGTDRDSERSRFDRDEYRYGSTGRRRRETWGSGDRDRSYQPRSDFESDQVFAASGYGRGDYPRGGFGRGEDERTGFERAQSPWGRDEYRRTSFAGSSERAREHDPHYHSWRQRHMSELDRDYDDYRRENQSRFEDDFKGWRDRRMQKRGLLGQIREHMEVVGNDDQHVGKVDRVVTDRIILTKSDPESGGVHHSLSCSDIDRVEGERVILDCTAEEARRRWRDESRSRALFEREDQGEIGPRMLDRSFEGTYR